MDSVKPTLVIGVGEAGRNMVRDTRDLINSQVTEATADAFSYITIDTEESVAEDPMDSTYPILIKKPEDEDDWFTDSKDYHYLSPEMSGLVDGATGADRQRGVSRYHLEKGQANNIKQQIKSQIEELKQTVNQSTGVDYKTTNRLNVWMMNSLGGGTGSGGFIFLSLLIDDLDVDLQLRGIGDIPELSVGQDPDETMTADGSISKSTTFVNTYPALRELAALVNHDSATKHYRGEDGGLQLEFGDDQRTRNIKSSPFGQYFLLGHDEDTPNKQLNRTAGSAVLFYALHDSPENFPDGDVGDDEVLYIIDAAEVHTPIEPNGEYDRGHNLRKVIELREEISGIQDRIDTLESEVDDRRQAKEFLTEILERPVGTVSASDYSATAVDVDLVSDLKNEAESVKAEDITNTDSVFSIEEKTGRLETKLGELIPNSEASHFRDEDVITYFYSGFLEDHLNAQVLQKHDFSDSVKDTLGTLKDEDTDRVDISMGNGPPLFEYDNVVAAWNRLIESELDARLDEYKQKAEQQGFFDRLTGEDYRQKKTNIENRLERMRREKANYNQIETTEKSARTKKSSADQIFERVVNRLTDEIESRNETKRKLRKNVSSKQSEIEQEADTLQETEYRNDRYARLGLDERGIDESLCDKIENDESIPIDEFESVVDLFKVGNLNAETVSNQIQTQVGNLSNDLPLLNSREDKVEKIFCLTTGDGIVSGVGSEYNILNQTVAGTKTLESEIDASFDYHDDNDTRVTTDSGFSILLLSMYTDIKLDSMYEYSHLHDNFVTEKQDVKDTVLGREAEIDDTDLARHFAYPELLSNSDRIRNKINSDS